MESGTLKALSYYLTNQAEAEVSFQYKLALGLGAGLTDLCKMMVLNPEEDDFSEILALLYDLSSRIKVPPFIVQILGASGDSLKDIVDFIATTDSPVDLGGKILSILPLIVNPLLGSDTNPIYLIHILRSFIVISSLKMLV